MKKEDLIEFFTAHNFTTETDSMQDDFKTWEVVRIINSEGGLAGYFLFQDGEMVTRLKENVVKITEFAKNVVHIKN